VRDGKWKLIARIGHPRAKLFDIEADPEERDNLIEQHPEFVTEWRRRLHDWASAQKSLILQPPETNTGEIVSGAHGVSTR
jgi:hypothetical protein